GFALLLVTSYAGVGFAWVNGFGTARPNQPGSVPNSGGGFQVSSEATVATAALRQFQEGGQKATSNPTAAEQAYRRALDLRGGLATSHPETRDYRDNVGRTCLNLGGLLLNNSRLQEAEPFALRAVEEEDKLAAKFPAEVRYRYHLALSLNNLGLIRMKTNDEQ